MPHLLAAVLSLGLGMYCLTFSSDDEAATMLDVGLGRVCLLNFPVSLWRGCLAYSGSTEKWQKWNSWTGILEGAVLCLVVQSILVLSFGELQVADKVAAYASLIIGAQTLLSSLSDMI